MLRILKQILVTGTVTEPPPADDDTELERLGIAVRRLVQRHCRGSLAIRQLDAGSCNACELELHALTNPWYDLERFGVHFVASPRHADALLVTGPVTRHMETALLRTWRAMPAPRYVIAAGDCACGGGTIGTGYATRGGVAALLPVDARVAGCPPAPLALLQGLRVALGRHAPGGVRCLR